MLKLKSQKIIAENQCEKHKKSSLELLCLAQGQKAVTPMRLEPVAPLSRVKHSTTEPLPSPDEQWAGAFAIYSILMKLFDIS